MQEQTRKRLTLFARLWAIPMLLFIVLSVVAVIAGMDERKNLMGAAVVGIGVMLVLLLCQVIAAVVVRRWWCVVGGVIGVLVSIFVMLTSIVALGAGQYRPPVFSDEDEAADSIAVAETDSASFYYEEDQLMSRIVIPLPETSLRKAVGQWIDNKMGERYKGDKGDIEKMVEFYGKNHIDSLRNLRAEGVPDFAELCYDVDGEKLYDTEKAVTYQLTTTLDFGGPHPLTIVEAATFRKSDGRMLNWDAVPNGQLSNLRNLIREKLMNYFDVETHEELMEYLQGVDDVNQIPLPDNPPYMTETGFSFIYQQYEIAAYAMGMPNDTISFQRFKPYLVDWAQQLIP